MHHATPVVQEALSAMAVAHTGPEWSSKRGIVPSLSLDFESSMFSNNHEVFEQETAWLQWI
jgi:hypothetical protein